MKIIVKAKTNSKVQSVKQINKNEFKVNFRAKREKGEANKKLLEILAKFFNVPKSNVKILRGYFSTTKLIKIEGIHKNTEKKNQG